MQRECKARLHVQSCLVGFPSVCYLNYIAFQRLGANMVYQINQLAGIAERVKKVSLRFAKHTKQTAISAMTCVCVGRSYILDF